MNGRESDGRWQKTGAPAAKKPATPQMPVIETCLNPDCGTPVVPGQRPSAPMVRVAGSQDGARQHWFCPGRCTGIAQARADLRSIKARPAARKGGRRA
ncbi:hypothetical protein ABTZ78_17000 [Streptomyces bauhiniae]|uniref:hypothetical protein n=1 Tax=Streptomyces bauhiniae TaxID=2340725 RepID=UPI00331E35CE